MMVRMTIETEAAEFQCLVSEDYFDTIKTDFINRQQSYDESNEVLKITGVDDNFSRDQIEIIVPFKSIRSIIGIKTYGT